MSKFGILKNFMVASMVTGVVAGATLFISGGVIARDSKIEMQTILEENDYDSANVEYKNAETIRVYDEYKKGNISAVEYQNGIALTPDYDVEEFIASHSNVSDEERKAYYSAKEKGETARNMVVGGIGCLFAAGVSEYVRGFADDYDAMETRSKMVKETEQVK